MSWDGSTNSVYIGSQPSNQNKPSTPSTSSTPVGTVLMDKNGIKITYTGVKIGKKSYDDEMTLKIENNSDKDQTVQVRDFSINGIMFDPIFSSNVAKGKTAIGSIYMNKSSLADKSITSINSFEFKFKVFEQDDWLKEFDSDVIKVNVK